MSHVDVYMDAAGEFRWRKKAANGETVADSGEGYTRRADAITAAERENPGVPLTFDVEDAEAQGVVESGQPQEGDV